MWNMDDFDIEDQHSEEGIMNRPSIGQNPYSMSMKS